MKTAVWKILAFIVSRRPIAHWLIRRSMATPYFHLAGYMERWWLFNPYAGSSSEQAEVSSDRKRHSARRWTWLPSIRVHHILRADNADHPHDHPWDARTIILDGGYFERRHAGTPRIMRRGDTAAIRHGDFHHIEHVTPGGVWTLFFTWDYQGSWGFLVDGVKVPWRVYEAEHQRHDAAGAVALAWTEEDMAKPCGPEVAFLRNLSKAAWVPDDVGGMLRHCAKLLEGHADRAKEREAAAS